MIESFGLEAQRRLVADPQKGPQEGACKAEAGRFASSTNTQSARQPAHRLVQAHFNQLGWGDLPRVGKAGGRGKCGDQKRGPEGLADPVHARPRQALTF